ncbi:MAG: tripartite tricarboxylate transporter substrate binding protein [Betaproteobacteria bacterium]|nr:tripartite tricarboxylate transporter substrate binding protein [Betaproteobacteria bacterium]
MGHLNAIGRIVASIAASMTLSAPLLAQDYPAKPIQFLIGFALGGSSDLVSRLMADQLAKRMGQPVVPINKPTAGGIIANETVARASPDGYNLVLLSSGHPIAAVMSVKMPYDAVNDFAMVSTVTSYPMLITVAADSPVRSFEQLLTRARAQPGRVTYAIAGPASAHRLLGELIQIEARVDMVGVTFKGAAQAMIDLLGGRIDAMVETATFSLSQVKGGKMRALAVSTAGRYAPLPDVPTVADSVPGVDFGSWLGLATSPGTPRPIIDRLHREVGAMLKTPEVRQQLANLGGEASPSSPDQMRDRIAGEMVRWKRVMEIRKISPN